MSKPQPNFWRARLDPETGRWVVVRLNALGRVSDTSPVSYGSRKAATRDAVVWNEMDGLRASLPERGQ